MPYEFLMLRLLHVVGGIFWVGGGLYATLFVTPALMKAGPAAGPILAEMQRRKLFTVLPIVAVITMLTGVRLLWIVSGGFSAHYFHTMSGHTYAAAGAASILAFVVAMFVSRPAGVRLSQLAPTLGTLTGAERASAEAQVAKLRTRASVGTAAAIVLLTASAIGMSIARYL